MEDLQQQINFEKRFDKWEKYRKEIINESIKMDGSNSNSKKIKSLINSINSIDKAILQNLDESTEIKLAEVSKIESSNLQNNYMSLRFNIPDLDESYLEQINEEIKQANNIKKQWYVLDESKNNMIANKITSFSHIENVSMNEINNSINDINNVIQFFPKNADEKLKKLNKTINETNNLIDKPFNMVKNQHFKESFNFKFVMWSILAVMAILMITSVIVLILFLTL